MVLPLLALTSNKVLLESAAGGPVEVVPAAALDGPDCCCCVCGLAGDALNDKVLDCLAGDWLRGDPA